MRVAITGSSGLVGRALTAALEARGDEVLRMVRGTARSPDAVWDPAAGWIGDGALEGVDAIVHLGGSSIGGGRWTKKVKEELRSSRIDSANLLIDHCKTLERKPSVFLSSSAVGFYGDRGDEELTEDAPHGEGFLAQLCVDWEVAANGAEEFGARVIKVRMGVVVDGEAEAFKRLVMPFKFGVGARLGSGRQWFPWVALADVVRALVFLLDGEHRGVFNLTTPEPQRHGDFIKTVGRVMRRPLIMPVPGFVLRLALGQAADELLLTSQRVIPKRLTDAGFTFDYADSEPAIRAALGKA